MDSLTVIYEPISEKDNQQIWNSVYNVIMKNIRIISAVWHNALKTCQIGSDLPSQQKINYVKQNIAMDIQFTPPLKIMDWYEMLSCGKFPNYNNFRTADQIRCSKKPDFCHDFLGHIPMLIYPQFVEAMIHFADVWVHSTREGRDHLIKYWFYSVEFGLIYENAELKALGAGLITSEQVMQQFISGALPYYPYNENMLAQYEISATGEPQVLFCFDSLQHIIKVLKGVSIC